MKKTLKLFIYILSYYLLLFGIIPIIYLIQIFTKNPDSFLLIVYVLSFFVFIVTPFYLFIKAALTYKKYSFSSIISIFIASFLIIFPLGILFVTGLSSLGHFKEAFWDLAKSGIAVGIIASFFGGLIGLLLNSIYILILRFQKRSLNKKDE